MKAWQREYEKQTDFYDSFTDVKPHVFVFPYHCFFFPCLFLSLCQSLVSIKERSRVSAASAWMLPSFSSSTRRWSRSSMPSGRLPELGAGLQPPAPKTWGLAVSCARPIATDAPTSVCSECELMLACSQKSRRPGDHSPVKHCQFLTSSRLQ